MIIKKTKWAIMNIIEFKKVTKTFDDVTAINNLSFNIKENEIVALLGPSGCGKSTILRTIAGFETTDKGKILINDQVATDLQILTPPNKRNIGMVFQDFALFPHLTIAKNIGFGLTGNKKTIKQRVKALLSLIKMEAYGQRMPHEVSGGQQQRVAVARALAQKPKMILLDEPFSSLDTALRSELRQEIREILKAEGVSALIVTHDQAEAFEFSDRMIVMKDGTKIQEGTPKMIYQSPINAWCANFVGQANFVNGKLAEKQIARYLRAADLNQKDTAGYTMMIRPENIHIAPQPNGGLNGQVVGANFVGESELIKVKLEDDTVIHVKSNPLNFDYLGRQVGLTIENYQIFQN